MNDDDGDLEQRLVSAMPRGAPPGLRDATLAQVRRELRSARWDRRLGRLAVAIFLVGIGLNASLALRSDGRSRDEARVHMARGSQIALAQTAMIVADATDAETARRFVRHLAAMASWEPADE